MPDSEMERTCTRRISFVAKEARRGCGNDSERRHRDLSAIFVNVQKTNIKITEIESALRVQ